MDTKELLKKVRKIEIKTKGLSKHIFSGEYHSAFKGRGMSFSEVRDYQYGDDIRNIDWNVTARYGETQVKVFEEEREMTLMLLIDISASSLFGSTERSKSDLIAEISAVLAFSALANNDKVGAILFTDKIERYISPKKGKQNILLIIREILGHEPTSTGTDIGMALRYFNNIQKKRTIAFVVSDFMDKDFDKEVKMAGKRHDVIGLHIFDTREMKLPSVGILKIKDLESGRQKYINTWSRKVREAYEKKFIERYDRITEMFKKSGNNFIDLSTDQDYVKVLMKFFKSRKQ